MTSRSSTVKRKERRVLVRADVVLFLTGAGPLEGVWFGDRPPGRPAFWWRTYLPAVPSKEKP